MTRRWVLGVVSALATLAVSGVALAEVRVVRGQFTDRVENGRPVGDASTLANARTATYWLEFSNSSDPTTVTVVWRLDGREARRQSLNVGRGSRWRTWASHRIRGARQVEVRVLDAAGAQIHTESTTLAAH